MVHDGRIALHGPCRLSVLFSCAMPRRGAPSLEPHLPLRACIAVAVWFLCATVFQQLGPSIHPYMYVCEVSRYRIWRGDQQIYVFSWCRCSCDRRHWLPVLCLHAHGWQQPTGGMVLPTRLVACAACRSACLWWGYKPHQPPRRSVEWVGGWLVDQGVGRDCPQALLFRQKVLAMLGAAV